MQGGKNWFLPKEMNANRFFWDSHWLEIWSNHFYPSMGPNGGSVAMDSVPTGVAKAEDKSLESAQRPNEPTKEGLISNVLFQQSAGTIPLASHQVTKTIKMAM